MRPFAANIFYRDSEEQVNANTCSGQFKICPHESGGAENSRLPAKPGAGRQMCIRDRRISIAQFKESLKGKIYSGYFTDIQLQKHGIRHLRY